MRTEEQGKMVVRALKALGGEADAQQLKVFLIGSDLVPAKEWTTFWRKARAAAEKDPRIDHSRAFEQVYDSRPRGRTRRADRTPLPALEVRKPAKNNLGHDAQVPRPAPRRSTGRSGAALRALHRAHGARRDGDRTDRARAGLYFSRWYPERRHEWVAALRDLWEQGLAIIDLPTEDEQLALLAESRTAGVEAEAILSALDSRFAAVREPRPGRDVLDDAGAPSCAARCSSTRCATRPPCCG